MSDLESLRQSCSGLGSGWSRYTGHVWHLFPAGSEYSLCRKAQRWPSGGSGLASPRGPSCRFCRSKLLKQSAPPAFSCGCRSAKQHASCTAGDLTSILIDKIPQEILGDPILQARNAPAWESFCVALLIEETTRSGVARADVIEAGRDVLLAWREVAP